MENKLVILDGAMGTMLQNRGMKAWKFLSS